LAVTQAEYGLNITLDLTYVPYQIKESLSLGFDQEQGLQVTSNNIQAGDTSEVASAGSY